MKAMILAAGLGTRLRPLTYEMPKPIVPVLGQPLCTYNMEFLLRSGAHAFVLNLHHKPKIIQQKITEWSASRKVRTDFTLEPEILGTGGGIRNARSFLSGGTFVTANSDTIVRFPFSEALAFHRWRKALATLVLFPDPRKAYTPVWTDPAGRITGFGKESGDGSRSGFYTGFQIVEPDILAAVPEGRASCIVRDTYTPLIAKGAPIYGFLTSGSFRDFGSPADYLNGTLALLAERSAAGTLPAPDIPGATVRHPVFIAGKARILPGATIGPEAVIEEGAVVAAGATVSRAILWPGAQVREPGEYAGMIITPGNRVAVATASGTPMTF